ncbi:hypothetical protein [Streptomyces sp. NPDC001070]
MSETTPETTEVEEPAQAAAAEVEETEEPAPKSTDTTVKPDNFHTP